MSALHMASLAGHAECCRKLLQYGKALSFCLPFSFSLLHVLFIEVVVVLIVIAIR